MKRNLIYFILYLFFMVSCSDDSVTSTDKLVDIDILDFADIAISRENQKIVNAVASKLLKDENNIYLKAEYDITESSEIRSKLTQTVIQDPSSSNRIMTLALDLHKKDGKYKG